MTTTVPLQQTAYVASNQPHHFNALSISFRESATVPGIPLSYASNPHLLQQRLEDWDQEFPADNKAKVSIRLQPLGYRTFSRQMHARHIVNGRPTPINLAKAVQLVADAVQAFIAETQGMTTVPSGAQFSFGPNGVTIDNLILVSLRRVSNASYQPELWVVHSS